MCKVKSIYLPCDREAAEKLKNLSVTLKSFLENMSAISSVNSLQLARLSTSLHGVIRVKGVRKDVRNLSMTLRDLLVAKNPEGGEIVRITKTLLDKAELDLKYKASKYIKKEKDDIGMTERYRHLTTKLGRERLHKLGNKHINLMDMEFDKKADVKLVRRIVEKRAAQEVHKTRKKSGNGNKFRQQVRRVSSFSLYSTSFTDYDNGKRSFGTHWTVTHIPGKGYRKLRAKRSYGSYEEAWAACENYMSNFPDDPKPVSPYICEQCGRWHFGHDKYMAPFPKAPAV
ncbi:MAG: hypothetical protein HDS97_05530 [Bacteroidales bacterium]|nr:hypothetical protein [Bacteroidales bacterium]